MERYLMILEVSGKQGYIFANKHLKENSARSSHVSYITSDKFFSSVAGEYYTKEKTLVYAGGGHAVAQFDDQQQATEFAKAVSYAVMTQYSGLELFIKQMEYDASLSPGENLRALAAALERKKSLRNASFRQTAFGMEELDSTMFHLVEKDPVPPPSGPMDVLEPPMGCRQFPSQMDELAGDDNFIAVVHIDGNGMGNRVNKIYETQTELGTCFTSLRRFSEGIQRDFEAAFAHVVETLRLREDATDVLPIRPIILAGDDVCFVTAGNLGLECARLFLEKLASMENAEQPGIPYASCAGVALVHTKYPFHRAYELAEELCSSAKRFGASIDPDGRISAMDWHIEFGQLKDGLSELREDYACEDGARMELRPVAVHIPASVEPNAVDRAIGGVRTYQFVSNLCCGMKSEYGKTARGKIKELRAAFKQGQLETEFVLCDWKVSELLWHDFSSRYSDWEQKKARFKKCLDEGKPLERQAFLTVDGVSRCLFFDAIEMIDHYQVLQEAE